MAHSGAVSFLQANLQHAKAASYILGRRFGQQGLDVGLIQEPWVVGSNQIGGLTEIPGKVLYVSSGNKPRACIVLKKDIDYVLLTGFCTEDVISARISVPLRGGRQELVICSAYFPGEAETGPPPNAVRELVHYCRRSNHQLVIGCDANAHHTIWGSTNVNDRGEYLFNYILGEGLVVINTGSKPTFLTRVRQEVLDITISTPFISERIVNWHVSDEPSCSDHRHIRFDVTTGTRVKAPYRDPRCTNWEAYKADLAVQAGGIIKRVKNIAELELATEQLQVAMQTAYHNNCPTKVKTNNRGTPWWSKKLETMRASVRRLFNRSKELGNWEEYRTVLTTYNKEVRKAKRESWKRFCQEVSDTSVSARIHKVLSKGPTPSIGMLKRPDGSFTESAGEVLEQLVQHHFPGSTSLSSNGPAPMPAGPGRGPYAEGWRLAKTIINQEVIGWAIDKFAPFKSPGMDNIFPALLQRGKSELLPILKKIFRASLALGYIPSGWTVVRVVYIPKVAQGSTSHPKNYRPISLTSFLLKTLESILDRYVRGEALGINPLSPFQHAYQTGKSTETALAHLVNRISHSIDNGETALTAFLDIEGAFNNALPESLYSAAVDKGIPKAICDWIRAMLSHRVISCAVGGVGIRVLAARGCPQGGVLSPLLWSLLVDTLIVALTGRGVEVQAYADDLVIMARGKFQGVACDILQKGLNTVARWCEREELSVNPAKTVIVPFTRKRKLKQLKELQLNGVTLPYEVRVKYLGVILDMRLTWNTQLDRVISKASQALWVCKRTCGKTWGMSPYQMHWLYTVVILPVVTYGAIAWWTKLQQKTARLKLARVQRQACLAITGAMSSTPTAAMGALLNLPPLHLRVEAAARGAAYRMLSGEDSKLISRSGIGQEISNHPILGMTSDAMLPKYNWERPFRVLFPSREDWNSHRANLLGGNSIWYTDGSRSAQGAGAGVYGGRRRSSVVASLGLYSTIFQAEIYAIDLCVQQLLEQNSCNKVIKIISDSQAALRALERVRIESKLVWNCLDDLKELGRRNRVTLLWAPGHSGLEGNEQADLLARAGAAQLFVGPEPVLGIAKSLVKRTMADWVEQRARGLWSETEGCTQSKAFVPRPSRRRAAELLALSRNNLRVVTGLFTGHNKLRKHLHTIKKVEASECRFCQDVDETAEHILCSCPELARVRLDHFGQVQACPQDFLEVPLREVIDFVKKMGLLEVL